MRRWNLHGMDAAPQVNYGASEPDREATNLTSEPDRQGGCKPKPTCQYCAHLRPDGVAQAALPSPRMRAPLLLHELSP